VIDLLKKCVRSERCCELTAVEPNPKRVQELVRKLKEQGFVLIQEHGADVQPDRRKRQADTCKGGHLRETATKCRVTIYNEPVESFFHRSP